MTWLLNFLASKLAAPLMMALAILSLIGNAGLGFLHWSDGRTISALTSESTRLAGDNATLRGNQAALKATIATQGTSIDSIKNAADSAANAAKAGQMAAEVAASALDRGAAAMKNTAPPPAGADRCAAASKLIHDTLAGEHSK